MRGELFQAVHDTAWKAHRAGICVVPPKMDGTKAPAGSWKRFQTETPSDDELIRVYGRGSTLKQQGVGFVTGAISGNLELLDFDHGPTWEDFRARAQELGHGALLERVYNGYADRTPREGSGCHLLYYCPDAGPLGGNKKLATKVVETATGSESVGLIETRSEGGYVVCAPSFGAVHHTGRRYVQLAGDVSTIATITPEEREALFRIARTFDEPAAAAKPPKPVRGIIRKVERPADVDLRPGDDFNQRADWRDLLHSAGWSFDHADSSGEQFWKRPGKTVKGHSATLFYNGNDLLYVFSSNAGLDPARSYDKIGFYAKVFHGGTDKEAFAAAAKALRKLGYGGSKEKAEADVEIDVEKLAKEMKAEKGDHPLKIHKPNAPPPVPPTQRRPSAGEGEADGRTEILLTEREAEVADRVVEAIGADPGLFQRNHSLVILLRSGTPKDRVKRTEGTPRVVAAQKANVRDRMSRHVRLVKRRKKPNGETYLVEAKPDDAIVGIIHARGEWPGIRHLAGVVEIPTLRPDGTVLDVPGYDESTGLFYIPNDEFESIPDRPTREDAGAAARLLLDLVADFPFKAEHHRFTWLAALLTVLVRYAVEGPVPAFIVDANCPGAGKTLLVEIISHILSGRAPACSGYPEREEEMEKVLLAIALAADPLVLFDNLKSGEAFGGENIDRAITASTIAGRILGKSERVALALYCVVFATGNNLGVKGDALRRILLMRLDSPEIRPEERDDFKIEGDLLEHVDGNRPALVRAALTIVRAFVVAGRPQAKLTPMDFPAWSRLVRQAVFWATGVDPCETRKEARELDTSNAELGALVQGWKALCESRPDRRNGLATGDAWKILDLESSMHIGLRGVLMQWSRDGSLPTSRTIGNRFKKDRGRVTDYGALDYATKDGNRLWYVKPPRSASSASSGSAEGDYAEQHAPNETHAAQIGNNTAGGATEATEATDGSTPHPTEDDLKRFDRIAADWPTEKRLRWGELVEELDREGYESNAAVAEAFRRMTEDDVPA